MPKLFELIVVEGQLKSQAQAARSDLAQTFEKKRHLFEEARKVFQPIEEGAPPVLEDQSDIQTTVPKELRWLAGIWSKAIDTSYQVAHGNTVAIADVRLDDGTVLLQNAPATALLELEKRLSEVQDLISHAPTLDPARGYRPDQHRGADIYQAREVTKTRTRKVQKGLVLYPHSAEHPAQTQLVSVDEPAGTLTEQHWSAMITPARKSELLARVEELRRAVKAALYRANAVELTELPTCAKALFDYVLR